MCMIVYSMQNSRVYCLTCDFNKADGININKEIKAQTG